MNTTLATIVAVALAIGVFYFLLEVVGGAVNGTAVATFLSFLLFVGLMKAVFFDPISRIKEERERKKYEDAENARKLMAEFEELTVGYEAQLAEARKKAQSRIVELQQKAKKEASEAIQAAREKAQSEIDGQLAELARWREEAYGQLTGERRSLMRQIIGKVTGHHKVSVQ